MNDRARETLRELGARARLAPEEKRQAEDLLEAEPAARRDWLEDRWLSERVAGLADAPVASNFTRRVMDAVAASAEERVRSRVCAGGADWIAWAWGRLGLAAGAGLAVLLAAVWYFAGAQREAERAGMARSVAQVSALASSLQGAGENGSMSRGNNVDVRLGGFDMLRDFDAIRRLDSGPAADTELLAALR